MQMHSRKAGSYSPATSVTEGPNREGVRKDKCVLIIDTDLASAHALGDELASAGYPFDVAPDGDRIESILDMVQTLACDVAICDVAVSGMDQFKLLEQVKLLRPNLPVIVVSRNSSIGEAVEAIKHGAFQYVQWPVDIGTLLGFIAAATDEISWRATIVPPSQGPPQTEQGELVYASAAMRGLVESIALVARSSAAVLILGESGTGKERVARAIHAAGSRGGHPFVAINASAIPEHLLESEIFGHVRGAFTGATQARRGLLLEAHKGTLLLDEIGDMPLALQPKLLRVLQFGETRQVGSDRTGHVDVRIIAATHRDLSQLVREGRFREDLHYRLNVIPLVVPPLRERREDVFPLITLFLQEARARTPGSPVESFSDEAIVKLSQAAWPGNVRELENTIERLVVLGRRAIVTAHDLEFLTPSPASDTWTCLEGNPVSLKELNRRYLDWILARTEGDKVRAAAILKIDLSTLYRWERAKG